MKKLTMSLVVALLIAGVNIPTTLAADKVLRAAVIAPDSEIKMEDGIAEARIQAEAEGMTEGIDDFEDKVEEVEVIQVGELEDLDQEIAMIDPYLDEDVCEFEDPKDRKYEAKLVAIRRKLRVDWSEQYRVKIFLQNTGNTPWFSHDSKCEGPKMYIGTGRERDRASFFYNPTVNKEDNNWVSSNRIGMDQFRTDPGEIASFTFWSTAPQKDDVYKEYFAPVIEGVKWLDKNEFSFEMIFGNPEEDMVDLRKKFLYSGSSGSVQNIDLNAEKTLEVDLSEQKVTLFLGDYAIRTFKVSTGAAATPTPVGETRISLKQNVRVGYAAPHYIMPKFMMFRAGGYGFHALPSLANDRGVFWTEALNHIGIPVSHGCIRLLPGDANFMYEFAEVGTRVVIHW